MDDELASFSEIAKRAHLVSDSSFASERNEHPFDARNLHPSIPQVVRALFDDGHYSQATFEACKHIDQTVRELSMLDESGASLMFRAFARDGGPLRINALSTQTEKDEQEGFLHLFAGGMLAFRNPGGHEVGLSEDPDSCLDKLSFVSMLLRRLDQAGLL